MDKLIPVFIVIGIIILGFIMKKIELNDVVKRIDFTNQYHKKLETLIDEISSKEIFNQQLYYELTSEVKGMQYELGSDGVFKYATDNLKGFSTSNYQLLINFLPELRDVLKNQNNIITVDRFNQSANDCDNMFIRHLGSLNELKKSIRKNSFNPFSSFSNGMKFIISLPILLLNWFGFISDEYTRKAKCSWFIKFLNFLVVLIGFIGAIMSIILGWNDFLQKLNKIF